MKRSFWAVMGEGLGHVTRALAVIEHLPECEVHLFASSKAWAYLTDTGYPHRQQIDGLMFRYRGARVAQLASLCGAIRFFMHSRARNVQQILTAADRWQPDLFVTDFKPSMPVAAQLWGRTLVSIDNQHRFSHCSLRDLPWGLMCYATIVGFHIHWAIGRPKIAVISRFCPEFLRPKAESTVLVDSVVRPAVASLPAVDEGFVLAYVRDLARCSCVVSTAGHQLICEACCLGKPMLAIPEPKQYEQAINACYLEKVGGGQRCDLKALSPELVKAFLDSATLRPRQSADGVPEVAEILRTELPDRPVSSRHAQTLEVFA